MIKYELKEGKSELCFSEIINDFFQDLKLSHADEDAYEARVYIAMYGGEIIRVQIDLIAPVELPDEERHPVSI